MAKSTFAVLSSITLALFIETPLAYSASLVGVWQTFSDKTGEAESLIQLTESNGRIDGKVMQVFSPPSDTSTPLCEACTGTNKDKPVVGMTILHAMVSADPAYAQGDILDPEDGQHYKCKLHLISDSVLEVRGYLGVSLFGRTQTWKRHH